MHSFSKRLTATAWRRAALLAAALCLCGPPAPTQAQTPPTTEPAPAPKAAPTPAPSACRREAVSTPLRPLLRRARFDGALAPDQIAITYIGHSTFLIQTPGGLEIGTDYSDSLPPSFTPEVVTMNGAHRSHYSDSPPAAIALALRGWNPSGGAARHDVTRRDGRIRNVTTDVIRGPGSILPDANSIFIFEIGELCIAHFGHLHAPLTRAQLSSVGRIDIMFAPVEGGYMLGAEAMREVAHQIGARIVIPMHYFSSSSLARFVSGFGPRFAVDYADSPTRLFSKATLPKRATLLILPSTQ
ncbi:MAG: MBL fold metallo-hydrolase [Neomegalonema sp.]|nr:MBL fold metallo-hydrolase [Neomegalonema sp.]